MGTSGWGDLGFDVRHQQRQEVADQQKIARQAKLSAIIGDSLNALPLPKDENGNPDINNPVYNDILQRRHSLIGSLMDEYTPVQHANIVQRIGGLITGNKQHAMPHHNQPLPVMGTGPAALAAQAGGEQAAQAQQDLQAGQAAPPVPPTPTEPQHPMAALPDGHPANKILQGIKSLGETLKSHGQAFVHPAIKQPDQSELIKNIAEGYQDPKELQHERDMELWGVRGQNSLAVAQEHSKALMASLAARPPRMLSQTTIPNLLDQIKVDPDQIIYGPNGQILSPAQLAEMPPGTIAREFKAGPNVFYALGDQNSKTMNVGGQVYSIPSVGPITADNSTSLGTATGALAKTHEVPAMNPGEKAQLTTQPVATPGMTGGQQAPAPVAAPSAEAPPPTLKTRPVPATPPVLPPSPSQKATVDKVNAGRSKSKQIPVASGPVMPPPFAKGTMLAQGRSAQPVVSAMSVMAANVFGGDGEPPIWEYAKMYDDPQIRQALNNALTLNALANPGTEDNPTVMQQLATAVGATQWGQEQVNQANVKARQDLEKIGGPDALKMFAREAALQEDLSALRTATKASAAQGSIRTLVRAAPVYNVSSSQNFRDQLGATLNTAAAGMRGYPAINPEYTKWWDRGVAAAKGGPVSANAPKPNGSNPPIKVQTSPSTGQSRYSTDGGKTWQMGKPPQK